MFLSQGHASGAAGIYLSWDKNQNKEITKDEVVEQFSEVSFDNKLFYLANWTIFS